MHLKQFLKTDTVLNMGSLNSEQKIALHRQQVLLIHNNTMGVGERTQCDLFQNHLCYLHGNHAAHYYETHAFKVKAFVEKTTKAKVEVDFKPNFSTSLIGDFEPLCQGNYETCQAMEPTIDDLGHFKSCLSAKKPLYSIENKNYIAIEKKTIEARNNVQLPINRRLNDLPSTSAQARRNQEKSLNLTHYLQLDKNQRDRTSVPDISSSSHGGNAFRTAREELIIQNAKNKSKTINNTNICVGIIKRSLGGRRTVKSAFVPPFPALEKAPNNAPIIQEEKQETLQSTDDRLLNIDPKMIELIDNEIMHKFKPIDWHDIAGLEYAKSIIKEAIVYPLLRPDIFTGLRRPPRGILLFGPPGTGKTLIGKCIASQANATFFSISASSLTSKWIGESEKMVRALFAVAAVKQPSVVFIDEIDSLLSQRSDNEHESSRRLKTEFLVQLDGAATCDDDRVLIVGATNRPQELDEAARRRLVRRLYIPLPDCEARCQILISLLQTVRHNLSETDLHRLGELTEGYSGADMKTVCHEASMEPIRSIPAEQIPFFKADTVRSVNFADFNSAMQRVRPSVSQSDLKQYIDWNQIYGSCN